MSFSSVLSEIQQTESERYELNENNRIGLVLIANDASLPKPKDPFEIEHHWIYP